MPPPSIVIYHNSRCSKSRSACELLAGNGLDAKVIEYLKTPPNREELQGLLSKLGMKAADLVRRSENVFKENYAGKELTEGEWLDVLCLHPILIERPIVVFGDRAVVARPPEKLLELIDAQG